LREISQLGHGALHAGSLLVLLQAGQRFVVAMLLVSQTIEGGERIERAAAYGDVDPRRTGKIRYQVPFAPQPNPLMLRREKARSPQPAIEGLIASLAAGDHHDECRQVVVFRAQAVTKPRPETGTPRLLAAGLQQRESRVVVDGFSIERTDQAQLVSQLGCVRQELAELHAALAIAGELERRVLHRVRRLLRRHRREPLPHPHRGRQFIAVLPGQFGLGIEQIDLRRSARLAQKDHPLRPRRKMGPWRACGELSPP
jgi:hypothetical protein